ncbi:hypothetical protein KRMM14A1259_61360 [Krasilnikovia sp. MM14-A1259]
MNRPFGRLTILVTAIAIVFGFAGPAQAATKTVKRCNRYVCATFKVTTAGRKVTVRTTIARKVRMYTCNSWAGVTPPPPTGGDPVAFGDLTHRRSVTYRFTSKKSTTYTFGLMCTTAPPAWKDASINSRIKVRL